jgi:periplasmic divalent cation tolerance protein
MTDCVVVLTTFPEEGADTLAIALVEERLAACVNVLEPMRSIYRWKGRVETAVERQVVIKTKAANVANLETRIKELHPYDLPEFLVIAVDAGSRAYLAWVSESS